MTIKILSSSLAHLHMNTFFWHFIRLHILNRRALKQIIIMVKKIWIKKHWILIIVCLFTFPLITHFAFALFAFDRCLFRTAYDLYYIGINFLFLEWFISVKPDIFCQLRTKKYHNAHWRNITCVSPEQDHMYLVCTRAEFKVSKI